MDGVTLSVAEGEILGIIGPNGAGKTTLLNCISGVYRLDRGDIRWNGRSIAGLAPFRVARLGIGRTFQIVKPFSSMTVRDNVIAGALFGSDDKRPVMKAAVENANDVLDQDDRHPPGMDGAHHLERIVDLDVVQARHDLVQQQ